MRVHGSWLLTAVAMLCWSAPSPAQQQPPAKPAAEPAADKWVQEATQLEAKLAKVPANSAEAAGVAGTPTFFINDVRYRGAYDLDSLARAVERAAAAVANRTLVSEQAAGPDPDPAGEG